MLESFCNLDSFKATVTIQSKRSYFRKFVNDEHWMIFLANSVVLIFNGSNVVAFCQLVVILVLAVQLSNILFMIELLNDWTHACFKYAVLNTSTVKWKVFICSPTRAEFETRTSLNWSVKWMPLFLPRMLINSPMDTKKNTSDNRYYLSDWCFISL